MSASSPRFYGAVGGRKAPDPGAGPEPAGPAVEERAVWHDEQAIRRYIDHHNQDAQPYLWTAQARGILEKVKRAWLKLKARGVVPKNQKFAARQSIERRLTAEAA